MINILSELKKIRGNNNEDIQHGNDKYVTSELLQKNDRNGRMKAT